MKYLLTLILLALSLASPQPVKAGDQVAKKQIVVYMALGDSKNKEYPYDPNAVTQAAQDMLSKYPGFKLVSLAPNTRSMTGGGIEYYGAWLVFEER